MSNEVMDLAALLDRDGYAVVPGVLGPEAVGALRAALDRPDDRDAAALRRRGEPDPYGVRDLLRRVPEVRRAADSAAVRALVEPVLGPGAFPVRGLFFDKTPGANWGVPWHRDLTIAVRARRDVPGFGPWSLKAGIPHVQPPRAVLEGMLTVRLHLDDCGPDNGPLAVIPGSHAVAPDDAADRALRDRVPAVACPVSRGGAVLMRPLILHASAPAIRPGHRRVIHLEFAAADLPGGLEWHESNEQ